MHDVARFAFGDYELDTGRVQLLRDGEPVPLEPKAFAVLRLLAVHAPHVVDKADLFALVWKDTAVTDNALTRIIAQLRKALGDDARDPRYIATVSARGYRLLPAVRMVDGDAVRHPRPAEPSAPAPITAAVAPADAAPAPSTRGGVLFAGAALVALIVAGAWF